MHRTLRNRLTVLAACLALTLPGGSLLAQSLGGGGQVTGNAFNPAISMILVGNGNNFTQDPDEFEIPGFALGGETGPGQEGLSLGESELDLSANVDDLFYGSVTLAFATEDGEVEVELEEAYIQALSLPFGGTIKAGRFFTAFGYLNEFHAHADDFNDRPLPYQAFLAGQHNDEGVQVSVVLPLDLYTEIGGGLYRGADFPAGGASNGGLGAQSAYLRLGGDIGIDHSWRLGFSFLHTDATDRVSGGGIAGGGIGGGGIEGGGALVFNGDSDLFAIDFKHLWAPNGDTRYRYLMLQGEFMLRNESGAYNDIPYAGDQTGWYAQAVYKFRPKWRAGYRHAELDGDQNLPLGLAGTALDTRGHKPRTDTVMVDWTHSEFSRLRLQYSRDRSGPRTNNQLMVQYILSIGAHGAHAY